MLYGSPNTSLQATMRSPPAAGYCCKAPGLSVRPAQSRLISPFFFCPRLVGTFFQGKCRSIMANCCSHRKELIVTPICARLRQDVEVSFVAETVQQNMGRYSAAARKSLSLSMALVGKASESCSVAAQVVCVVCRRRRCSVLIPAVRTPLGSRHVRWLEQNPVPRAPDSATSGRWRNIKNTRPPTIPTPARFGVDA